MSKEKNKNLWGGAFTESPDLAAQVFSVSVHIDNRLALFDIQGSIAHATMLASCGIISEDEKNAIISGLGDIAEEIRAGTFEWDTDLEDVHMNIEAALTDKIGKVGEKLHTARSRNDQVALDTRLYVRDRIDVLLPGLRALQKSLLTLAEDNKFVIIPGYTHLQQAQPVYFSHHILAYIEMFERDIERLEDVRKRVNVLPLGVCALAGTSIPIKREIVQELLGFDSITRNSIDTVSDRDYVIELVSDLTLIGMHLSRWAEEVILWSSSEFGFITIGDAFTTGSSAMPQKKNPDMAELTRGKMGRLTGNLVGLLTMMKGLPLAYNRDMQEDKEPLFDSIDTIEKSIQVNTAMITAITVNIDAISFSLRSGNIFALDLAEFLVMKGVPFREAHSIVGELVKDCLEKEKGLHEIPLEKLLSFHSAFSDLPEDFFTVEYSVALKESFGGTGTKKVARMIAFWQKKLK